MKNSCEVTKCKSNEMNTKKNANWINTAKTEI